MNIIESHSLENGTIEERNGLVLVNACNQKKKMKKQKRLWMKYWQKIVQKEKVKKKVSFDNDEQVKTLFAELLITTQEAGTMCTIDGKMIFTLMKNMLSGDLGTSCHITINDSGLYDFTNINMLVQGSLGCMPATKSYNKGQTIDESKNKCMGVKIYIDHGLKIVLSPVQASHSCANSCKVVKY